MPTWEPLSRHRYYREADLMFIEVHGDFTLSDTQGMYAVVERIVAEHGYVLMAFDGYDSGTLTPTARKYIGERSRSQLPDGGTAVIGAGLLARTLINLLRNASRLFGKRSPPMIFCATSEEALSWLAEQRKRCQSISRD